MEKKPTTTKKKQHKGSNATTENSIEYGVARGVDFQRVNFVLNVDCPPTLSRCATLLLSGLFVYQLSCD